MQSKFQLYGYWRQSIDTVLNDGIYLMEGASAQGTFPDSNAKYGILLSFVRSGTNFQILLNNSKIYTRQTTATGKTDWIEH